MRPPAITVKLLVIPRSKGYIRRYHRQRTYGSRRRWPKDRLRPRLFGQEGAMATENRHPNSLLASLPAAEFELLRPHLRPFDLAHETVLFDAGDAVRRVYFPHTGVVSLVIDLKGGEMIEAAMIGRDSIVGASSALDGQVSLNRG